MSRDNGHSSGPPIGFDVQGTNVLLENNIVYNDDDCLALCSPANNVVFRNTLCSGSHGVSIIGSMSGTTTDIQNVVYVIHVVVGSRSLTSCSKDSRCHNGELQFWQNL